MKSLFRLFSFVLMFSMIFAAFNPAIAQPGNASDRSRVFVQFAAGKKANVENALKAVGAEFIYAFDDLKTFTVIVPTSALAGLQNNPNILLVEDDVLRYPISVIPSKPATIELSGGQVVPFGLDMVQARDVWDSDRDGVVDNGAPTASNRKICIIDSGFYTGHEDLQGVNVSGYNGNLPWAVDGFGHGTHVAGTIVAMNNALGVVGVTPGTVSIYSVRVFGDDGAWAYSSTLIDAANRCASAGANIISMSLGGSLSSRTERIGFDNLYNQGILSIAAAGNDGNNRNSYPASYDSVVSVAAIDANKTVANFSQYNTQVELAAPGVGVLSTVPYLDTNSINVGANSYFANHLEFSARGTVTGNLVNGGLCDNVGSWAGLVVLCERGVISFYDKVMNVQNGGGSAAVIYNNIPGDFLGTLGAGNSSSILGMSISQENGQALVAGSLGGQATLTSVYSQPASGYDYYDGTSMATPHVSAVAALVWSAKPSATNAEIRTVLQQTAQDLGTAGRDNYYGFGLVQAKTAVDALGGGTAGTPMSVSDLDGSRTITKKNWVSTFTIEVKDNTGMLLSGVKVDGKVGTKTLTCTTGADGRCNILLTNKQNLASVTFTVSNLTMSGFVYDPSSNSDVDGDSDGTSITVLKQG